MLPRSHLVETKHKGGSQESKLLFMYILQIVKKQALVLRRDIMTILGAECLMIG